jgi:anthranilate phosphoribosyltransferase
MMKAILSKLFDHQHLTQEEARTVLTSIAKEEYNPSQVTAFITVYLMRSITHEELSGFRAALLDLCIKINFDHDVIDLCGTGGDGKNTFNISTLASFIVAGAGYKVAKHGNYGLSSVSGSSNVLELLGYKFTNDSSILHKQMDGANICFMHAPLFHPALKSVGPIRRELGVKTFFNMLGPLVNPASPRYQMAGVYGFALARLYEYVLKTTHKNFAIVHTLDGYDEISLTSDAKVITAQHHQVLKPQDFGFDYINPLAISGGATTQESADIFKLIISGDGSKEQNEVVIANAALAIQCISEHRDLNKSIEEARESLVSGKALSTLQKLLSIQ